MNHGPSIFFGILLTFLASWWGIVFAPQLQIGAQQPKTPEGAMLPYPATRPGIAAQGHQLYVANGCAYCHSQQIRQEGYTFDVVLTGTTNQQATIAAVAKLGHEKEAAELVQAAADKTPQPIKKSVPQKEATRVQKTLTESGASAQIVFIPVGADIGRGWGLRQSVALDYLYEYPVQIGNSRLGPDLSNVGVRRPDAQWHLRHLYDPRTEEKTSMMPAYRYLFEKRKVNRQASPNALKLPPGFVPAGFEIVPTEAALQLAVYMQSLRIDTPLFEAPMTQLSAPPTAAADTNAPAGTNAPATTNAAAAANTASTNAPAATNTPTTK